MHHMTLTVLLGTLTSISAALIKSMLILIQAVLVCSIWKIGSWLVAWAGGAGVLVGIAAMVVLTLVLQPAMQRMSLKKSNLQVYYSTMCFFGFPEFHYIS